MASLLGAATAAPSFAAADQPIVASLNPPPAGLNCTDAAAATSVYFQFANPPFQVSQVSLYLDGKGVAQDAVDEHWPTVTLTKGLHPGSNTVDVVANGANGQHIERRLVVDVGGNASGSGTAQVACSDTAAPVAQQVVPADPAAVPLEATAPVDGTVDAVADQTPPSVVGGDEPAPVVVQDTPPVVYDEPTVVYSYPPPVYVYNPYPVVAIGPWVPFAPFFSFGFFFSNYHPYCPPPAVVYNNYYGGWHGGGYHGGGWNGGGWNGGGWNGGGWHGGGPNGGGWNGNGWRGGSGPGGAYPQPHPPGGVSPGFRGAPQPMNAGNGGNRFNPPQNGGWHGPGQAAPQPRPVWHGQPQPGGQPAQRFNARPVAPQGAAQFRTSFNGPVQVMRGAPSQAQFRPAPMQQFRAAPMPQQFHAFQGAPAFRGGGFGGGFHAPAPAFHGGGGGHGGGFGRR